MGKSVTSSLRANTLATASSSEVLPPVVIIPEAEIARHTQFKQFCSLLQLGVEENENGL